MFNQMIVVIGWFFLIEFNLQNILICIDVGWWIWDVFVVGDGYVELMMVDYSQIEMWIMVYLFGDEGFIEVFNIGEDLYLFVVFWVFGVFIDEVIGELWCWVKVMFYGLVYGLSVYGLLQQLKIFIEEVNEQMDVYFV